MDESLPCPVCGGRAWAHYEPTTIRIYCPRCDILGPKKDTIEEARAAWNALPRALEWTDEPPKVPGRYWFKDEYGIRIAWIKHDSRKMNELYAVIGGVGNWMSTLHGQWAGPIPEPREPKE